MPASQARPGLSAKKAILAVLAVSALAGADAAVAAQKAALANLDATRKWQEAMVDQAAAEIAAAEAEVARAFRL